MNISKVVINDAMDNFIRPAVVWSAGKDSTVVLNLVRDVARDRKMAMPPAILIDHGQHYDETYKMVEDISKEWGFKVIYARNDDFLSKVDNNRVNVDDLNEDNQEELRKINFDFSKKYIDYGLETLERGPLLKTAPFNDVIRKYRFDSLYTGVSYLMLKHRGFLIH